MTKPDFIKQKVPKMRRFLPKILKVTEAAMTRKGDKVKRHSPSRHSREK
jgi:hypothetical protein